MVKSGYFTKDYDLVTVSCFHLRSPTSRSGSLRAQLGGEDVARVNLTLTARAKAAPAHSNRTTWSCVVDTLRGHDCNFKLTFPVQASFRPQLRLRVTLAFHPPPWPFTHAVIHQVNKVFFLCNSLISPFPPPLWKILCCSMCRRMFSSIPVLYALKYSIII